MSRIKTKILWWIWGVGLFILVGMLLFLPNFHVGYLEEIQKTDLDDIGISMFGTNQKMVLKDNWGIFAQEDGSLNLLDVSDPLNLLVSKSWDLDHAIDNIFVEDNLITIFDANSGIYLYDFTVPEFPTLLTNYTEPNENLPYVDCHVINNDVILEEKNGKIHYFQKSEQNWTQPITSYDFNQTIVDITADASQIYLLRPDYRLIFLNKTFPFEVDSIKIDEYEYPEEFPTEFSEIEIIGDYLCYIGDNPFIFLINDTFESLRGYGIAERKKLDYRNPFEMIILENITVENYAIDGNIWFHTETDRGLIMMDISDPTKPTRLDHYWNSIDIETFAVSNSHVYLLENTGSVTILERSYNNAISTPNLILLLSVGLVSIIGVSLSSFVLFKRWRATYIEFQALLERNRTSIQIQEYLKKDLTDLRNFVVDVYPHYKKLQLTKKGMDLFRDFYEKLLNPETRVMDYTRSRARLIRYYAKTSLQIAQGIVHDHPIQDWEITRLNHEANYEILNYLQNHLNPHHPILLKLQQKFSWQDKNQKKFLL